MNTLPCGCVVQIVGEQPPFVLVRYHAICRTHAYLHLRPDPDQPLPLYRNFVLGVPV